MTTFCVFSPFWCIYLLCIQYISSGIHNLRLWKICTYHRLISNCVNCGMYTMWPSWFILIQPVAMIPWHLNLIFIELNHRNKLNNCSQFSQRVGGQPPIIRKTSIFDFVIQGLSSPLSKSFNLAFEWRLMEARVRKSFASVYTLLCLLATSFVQQEKLMRKCPVFRNNHHRLLTKGWASMSPSSHI